MDALGLTREAEGEARSGLATRGLIQLAGVLGAKYRVFELTARGREVSRATGLKTAKPTTGSWLHEAVIQHIQRTLGARFPAFRFQRTGISPTTGGVQPDLLLITPGWNRVPVQACVGNQANYGATALLRLNALAQLGPEHADHVAGILAIAGSVRHRDAIERAMKRQNGGAMPSRLVLKDFDSVVAPDSDWTAVFEVPL
jgi:hypothetical protein